MTPHQLLDLIAYQLAGLRRAAPEHLAAVRDDLAEAEALIGPAAEHVEREAERRQEAQRRRREETAEQNRPRFLPGVHDAA